MANTHRGEVEITLGDETYTVAPTFQTIAELEALVGPALTYLRRIAEDGRSISISQIVGITAILLKQSRGAPKPRDIGDLVMAAEGGPYALLAPISELLTNAITGGEEPTAGDAGNVSGAEAVTAPIRSADTSKSH